MKKIHILIILMLLVSFIPSSAQAFSKEVRTFDKIWYHPDTGFNKIGEGSLLLATTYTDNTLREVDYCKIEFQKNPFYFSIEFEDKPQITRNGEGNIIYQESSDGFVYLKKSVIDNYLPAKQLATKNIKYKTVSYQSEDWYQIQVPNFNRKYEWKSYGEPKINEKWFTWGSDAFKFQTRAMYIKLIKQSYGALIFDITHDSDQSGQSISISKSFLQKNGIFNPRFENVHGLIPSSDEGDYYLIYPPHFSKIGIHEASTGEMDCRITGDVVTSHMLDNQTLKDNSRNTPVGYHFGQRLNSTRLDVITKVGLRMNWGAQNSDVIVRVNNSDTTISSNTVTVQSGDVWKNFTIPYSDNFELNETIDIIYEVQSGEYVYGYYTDDVPSETFTYGYMLSYDHGTWLGGHDLTFALYGYRETHEGERVSGAITESNYLNTTVSTDFQTNTTLKIPVSNDILAITSVRNLTSNEVATAVNSSDDLVNNTYWFNSGTKDVWVRVENLSAGEIISWEVNGSVGANFSIMFPDYKEVGDDIILNGYITDENGHSLDGIISYTYLHYNNGSVAVGPILWNCTDGNYQTTISTSDLIPETYTISVKFYDPGSGTLYSDGNTLHLSWKVYFHFYNTNTGLGLPEEVLKIYVNNERLYHNYYKATAGEEINLTIKDFYNLTMYSNNFTINDANEHLDLGLTFHSYKICNKDEDYYMVSFLKEGAARWWEKAVFPYETVEFLIPSGNYTFRIYNTTYSEIYNTSILPINNSRGYIINNDSNLSLIIDGQSVISGQLLELASDLEKATMPDVIDVIANPPTVYSIYDRRGSALCGDTILVCPAQIMMCETINETTINETETIMYPSIPNDDVSENGTVTVLTDTIYFSGNYTVKSVNVSFGSNFTNYTNIPNQIDYLQGQNVTINCTGNLSVKRVTRYQQYWKFYWTRHTQDNWYEATIDFTNHMPSDTVYEVFCIVEYANDTTPDYVTTNAYDTTNGVYLARGQSFDTTAGAIHFRIASIPALSTRTFTFDYYGTEDPVTPSDAITVVSDYGWEKVAASVSGASTDKNYYYIDASWYNPSDTAFVGSLDIQLNFDTEGQIIAPDSWIVYDNHNDVYLERDDFSYHGGGLTISQDTLGTVQSNGARSYKAWFLFTEETATGEEVPFFEIDLGGGFLVLHLIILILAIPIVGGLILGYNSKKGKAYIWIAFLFILALFLFIMSQRNILL